MLTQDEMYKFQDLLEIKTTLGTAPSHLMRLIEFATYLLQVSIFEINDFCQKHYITEFLKKSMRIKSITAKSKINGKTIEITYTQLQFKITQYKLQ